MKRNIISIVLLLFAFMFTDIARAADFDVSKVRWGMNVKQVEVQECAKSKCQRSIDNKFNLPTLSTVRKIFGCDFLVSFIFRYEKLVGVNFSSSDLNRKDGLEAFNNIKQQLSKKIGDGNSEVLKYNSLIMGESIEYKNERTYCHLVIISGENASGAAILVSYKDIAFHKIADKLKKEVEDKKNQAIESQRAKELEQF